MQLLHFIVSADAIHFMHRDIKMKNVFVVQSHNLELARLAAGDFGAAQRGEEKVRHRVMTGDFMFMDSSWASGESRPWPLI